MTDQSAERRAQSAELQRAERRGQKAEGRRQKAEGWSFPLLCALRSALCALTFWAITFGCASAPPPAAPPPAVTWTELPAMVLQAFCTRLRDEGISRQSTVNVVQSTQPLVTANSLHSLAASATFRGRVPAVKITQAGVAGNATIPVSFPAGGCSWRRVEPSAVNQPTDTMTLELSAPLVNPFSHGAVGVLARMSLGGEGATWYWVPIVQRGGQSTAGTPGLLGLRD
jgi:hypothetical protein